MAQEEDARTEPSVVEPAKIEGEKPEVEQEQARPKAAFSKTPTFTAIHAARYHRQDLIKELEKIQQRTLLCYVSGPFAQIGRDDAAGLGDLLHNVGLGQPIDLLLHTPGGDIDATEKLITMLRASVGRDGEYGELRVVVPDYAKSAGTLIALGANSLIMSDSSELGTIDPQIWRKDGHGNDICHSVMDYLDAYREQSALLKKEPDNPAVRAMFDKFDPTILRRHEAIRERARVLAEDLTKRRGLNYSEIASFFLNTERWKSHSQPIGWQACEEAGLAVAYLPHTDPTWRKYWQLYCHQRIAIKDHQKLFESGAASLIFDS